MKNMLDRKLKEVVTDDFTIDINMPDSYPPVNVRSVAEGGIRDRFFITKAELPDEINVIRPFSVNGFPRSNERTIYVSPDGNDRNPGTKELPRRTLESAIGSFKWAMGGKIVLRGGSYDVKKTIEMDEWYSGRRNCPFIITAEEGEEVLISSSTRIPPETFSQLRDEEMLSRLKPEVRDKVLVCELKKLGIDHYAEIGRCGIELLINNTRQPLARYPNEGEPLIELGNRVISQNTPFEFGLDDPRPYEWKNDGSIYLFGALKYEWERYFAGVGEFNKETMTVKGDPNRGYPSDVQERYGNTFFFLNVFEELDAPGEWYLDREKGYLYLYPPKDTDFAKADIRLINDHQDIIHVENARHIIFDRLNIGRCAGKAIVLNNCQNVLIQRCVVTGVCRASEDDYQAGVEIGWGYKSGIIASRIEHFITRGVYVFGGNRHKLQPCHNFIQNCVIINGHNRFGLMSGGCGNLVSHNYIENTTALDRKHNEGIYEYNVFNGGDTETHDSGMIYVGGCGLSQGGNHYRYNYLYNFKYNDYGIYYDDLSRGMYAYGNVVVGNGGTDPDHWNPGGRSYNHHNGGDHCFYNNISVDAGYFAFGGDVSYWLFDQGWFGMLGQMTAMAEDAGEPEFLARFPAYKEFREALFEYNEERKKPGFKTHTTELEFRIRSPWHNHYENNVIFRAARPFKLDNGAETATGLDTNFITNDDPGFADLANKNYNIRPDAPLFEKIPDFVPPPFDKMGLVDDYE